jgi:membrane protein YqaA with SNARE-associated domain
MFRKLYDRVLLWSAHEKAPTYLAVLSAAESSFFPIPPDVMLAPMCLARPKRAWRLATVCTISSVLGGLLGFLIGQFAFGWVEPLIVRWGYGDAFDAAVASFEQHGFWYILLAGFTPVPYKVFTISAGVVGMPLMPFVAGSLAGRGGRFFLVAGLIRLGGEKFAERLRRYVDLIGWLVLLAAAVVLVVLKFHGGEA